MNKMNQLATMAGGKMGTMARNALGAHYPAIAKAAPKIALGIGIVGIIGGCIAACAATTKLDDIMDEHDEMMDSVGDDRYLPESTRTKAVVSVYLGTGKELVKNYAPAVGMIGGGIALVCLSNHILGNRLAAATSAYEIVSNGFKEYRAAVVKELGEEMDAKFRFGLEEEDVEEKVEGKDGKEKTVTKKKPVATNVSGFARFFDDSCTGWSKNPEYSLLALKSAQNLANDMLWARGSLLLNEVYDMLGMPRTNVGMKFGWKVEDGDTPETKYVDFGIYDWTHHPARKDFVNGYEEAILLDFNVDGPVIL